MKRRDKRASNLEEDSCIDQPVSKPEPFLDSMLEDNHAKLIKAHAAWYNEEDHETV